MSYGEKDWISAITKLVEMTSKQEIDWEIFDEYEEDPWSDVTRSYISNFGDNYYVIKSSKYRNYTDEDSWFWAGKLELEVYIRDSDFKFVRIASAPDLSVASTLFSVVENNFAFKKNALRGLLD